MARFITISLDKRGVSCRARLLDTEAPLTCEAVWNALPQNGSAFHAKYARNEVYTLDKNDGLLKVHDEMTRKIVRELNEPPHGGVEFTLRDLEGNTWSFGSYRGQPRTG